MYSYPVASESVSAYNENVHSLNELLWRNQYDQSKIFISQ